MMKKIISLVFGLLIGLAVWAQGTADTSASAKDSVSIGSHTEFSATKSADNVTKAQGDSAYMRNDYASAIQIYESLLKKGEAAEVYYNLGNSYYKADDIAKAILNYERALLLQPGNADIRANLEIARSKTIDKVTLPSEMLFLTWIQSLINSMSEKGWAQTGIVTFILTIFMLALFIFGKRVVWKKIGFISAICFFAICIFSNIFASKQKAELLNRDSAIIIAPSVTVKSTPNQSGTDLFILHEGRKVMIKDNTMKEGKEIRLEDGDVGWVPTNVIEII